MGTFTRSISDQPDSAARLLQDVLGEDADGDQLMPRTRVHYDACVRSMVATIEARGAKVSSSTGVDATALADHLQALIESKQISKATFRQYRAALLYKIRQQASEVFWRGESLGALGEAYNRVKDFREHGLANRGYTTSAKRVRMFPSTVMERIEAFAASDGRKYLHMHTLLAFLRANLVLGLRPSEWFDAALICQFGVDTPDDGSAASQGVIDDQKVSYDKRRARFAIRVANAKATHGRGNGGHRVILLNKLSKTELLAVKHFLEIVGKFMTDNPVGSDHWYGAFFKPIQQQLNYVLRRLGIKPDSAEWVSLYSTRHQTIANAKRVGISETEIAAIFGHGSSKTAFRHYARASMGTKGRPFNCRAAPESIAAVRNQSGAWIRETQRSLDEQALLQKSMDDVDMLMELSQ